LFGAKVATIFSLAKLLATTLKLLSRFCPGTDYTHINGKFFSMAWSAGTKLSGGLYNVVRPLGEGRYCTTYLAKSDKQNSFFAIKTLSESHKNSDRRKELEEKFLLESQQLAKCSHPNVVKVYPLFFYDDQCCLPMEYLQGPSLEEYQTSSFNEDEAKRYITQIGSALDHIHSNGIYHLDVRPDNVKIRLSHTGNEAVLFDFGSALNFFDESATKMTLSKSVGYAPPELQRGDLKMVDTSTDVYSLGAIFYKLITGKVPPDANERSPLNSLLVYPSYCSEQSYKLIEKAMSLSQRDRPQSAEEWLSAKNSVPFPPIPKISVKHAIALIAAVGTLLAGIAAVVNVYIQSDRSAPETPEQGSRPHLER
jgi:serine/threonine protein kinase